VGGEIPETGVAAGDPAGGAGSGAAPLPGAVYLAPGRPNPFRPATEIEFGLPRAATVSLAVFDVAGRCVRTLASGLVPAGVHVVAWDGRDAGGAAAAPGVYYCRLAADGRVLSRTMVRMR